MWNLTVVVSFRVYTGVAIAPTIVWQVAIVHIFTSAVIDFRQNRIPMYWLILALYSNWIVVLASTSIRAIFVLATTWNVNLGSLIVNFLRLWLHFDSKFLASTDPIIHKEKLFHIFWECKRLIWRRLIKEESNIFHSQVSTFIFKNSACSPCPMVIVVPFCLYEHCIKAIKVQANNFLNITDVFFLLPSILNHWEIPQSNVVFFVKSCLATRKCRP